MGDETGISWCDSTFNPWWGCWPVSPGCALCYADREASRRGYDQLWQKTGERRTFGEKHWNEPRVWARNLPKKLGRRPRVFCASMADIGEDHPVAEAQRPKLWELIEQTPELDWLLLTKRTATAQAWLPERWLADWPRHVWFGFSAEDQRRFDERIEVAIQIPALLFLSYEPALGPIDFAQFLHDSNCLYRSEAGICTCGEPREQHLSWVIPGGESAVPAGRARPAHPDWFRSARDQAVAAGAAFHFKQWGEWAPLPAIDPKVEASRVHTFEDGARVALLGRKLTGRLLDGRIWDEFPQSAAPFIVNGQEVIR